MNKPSAIVVNLPVKAAFNRLVESGLQANVRSHSDEMRLMQRQRGAAPNVDAFRHGGRVDAAGNVRSDTGTPIMNGWEGSRHEAISLANILGDMTSTGYSLVGVNLVQKEGKQPSLYLRFEENPAQEKLFPLWESLSIEITNLLSSFYGKVQIFRNPDETTTINPSMRLQQEEVPKLTDPRILRMTSDFHFRNQKVDATQATVRRDDTPKAAPAPEEVRVRRPQRLGYNG